MSRVSQIKVVIKYLSNINIIKVREYVLITQWYVKYEQNIYGKQNKTKIPVRKEKDYSEKFKTLRTI